MEIITSPSNGTEDFTRASLVYTRLFQIGLLLMSFFLAMHVLADEESEDPLEKLFMTALTADQAGDCETALPLYRSLSDEGVPGAMINLAHMNLIGHCVEKDPKKTLALLTVAASYHSPDAHIHLANLFYEGYLGEPNYKRAYLHLSQAAKMGLLNRPLFATMHYEGQGMDKEPLQAETILLEGIDAGDELSRTLLIEYYSDTQGPLYSPEKKMKLQIAEQLK